MVTLVNIAVFATIAVVMPPMVVRLVRLVIALMRWWTRRSAGLAMNERALRLVIRNRAIRNIVRARMHAHGEIHEVALRHSIDPQRYRR